MTMRLAFASLCAGLAFLASIDVGLAAPTREGGEMIHRLGPDPHQLRFEGENTAKSWTLYVTAAQAQTRARIHLSYSNAISVMPEVSTLAISVNDVAVAQTPIAAASDPGSVDVELPRGLLSAGYNNVRVAVTQRHRVDCGLEATYELWTQLDPATSGLTFPGLADSNISTLDDLAALSPDATGAVTIRAVVSDSADPEAIDLALSAVQAVVIRAGVARPSVEIVDALDARPGLWVIAGTRDDLRARHLQEFARNSDEPVLAGGDVPGRVIVVASGADLKQTRDIIDRILPARRVEVQAATPSAARGLANVNGLPIGGDTRVSLHDLGVQTEEFNGRLFRSTFDILMPLDFYAADYDKLTLSISAGYAKGLLPSAQVLVRVNEREAGSLPLRNPKGDLFRDRPISISLAALRPGVNRIVIEAQTPTPEDAACDVRNLMDAKKRFVLFDRSELIMPTIARIVRMPNLAVTLSSGFPHQGNGAGRLFLAKHDRATLGAAATFLSRAASISRRISAPRVTFDREDIKSDSALMVGSIEDFSPDVFDVFGIDYRALKETWTRAEPNVSEVPGVSANSASDAAGSPAVFDQWAEGVKAEPEKFGSQASLRAIYDRYFNVHRGDFALLRDPPAKIEAPEKSSLLLAQAHAPIRGPFTWTLVVGASEQALARDMRSLVAPSNWNQLEGRAASFSPRSGAKNVARSDEAYFVQTQTLTPANLRLVAAGWLSSNIDFYVIAVAFAAVILGFVTMMAVRAHGAKQ